jgi:YVTN family beta-propeller protein
MAGPGQCAGDSRETAAGEMVIQRFGLQNEFIEQMSRRSRNIFRAAAGVLFLAVAGCGNQYRPVVTPVRPTGPAAAPTAYAVAVTQPTGAAAGIATVLDFSGDTVLAQATIGNYPLDFTINSSGSTAYTIDSDGTLSEIPINTSLQTKNVSTSSLTSTANPINTLAATANVYVIDQNSDEVDVLTGSPPGLKQALQFPTGLINIVGRTASTRFYGISQGVPTSTTNPTTLLSTASACATSPSTVTTPGVATALEAATFTISATLPVGICPVYGLQSADGLRTFILNRGSGTLTVIDSQKNTLDTQINPTGTITLPAGPVYAELYDTTSQLVTANYDSNTISVIDVSTDAFDNDSPQFGTTHTIAVGNGPTSVTFLQDGSRAYVANSKDSTVSVVNMSSYTLEKTIPLPLNSDGTTPHPRFIASSYNYPTGKVYVTSMDSDNLTILRTDTDTVDATLQLQGNIVDVRVTRQNADGTTQTNNVTYSPGNGVPCTPGSVPAATVPAATLAKSACYVESTAP